MTVELSDPSCDMQHERQFDILEVVRDAIGGQEEEYLLGRVHDLKIRVKHLIKTRVGELTAAGGNNTV